jgi:mannose-P-dolichol utilization defect protein 1
MALSHAFFITPTCGKKQANAVNISERPKKLRSHSSGLVLARSRTANAVPVIAKATVSKIIAESGGDAMAKTLGYLLGAGSLLLYSPIIVKLLNTKQADGFSELTWMFNLVGLSAAVLYPYKKGFPLSTYIELLNLAVQSSAILGIVCTYKGLFDTYLVGMAIYLAVMTCLLKFTLPPQFLSAIQIVALIVCNYACIPQILLTFRTKKASWSPITAVMSMTGNIVRIFTTFQLTGDKLVMCGSLVGLANNLTLLAQCLMFREK